VVIGPNASMSARAAALLMIAASAAAFGIAAVLALQGYWPVLPFAGLEIAALGAAVWVSLQHNRYQEVLRFEGDRLTVQYGRLGRGLSLNLEWQRSPTRVLLEAGMTEHAAQRLLLVNGGMTLELGRCLSDEDKQRLAKRLRDLIHPAWNQKLIQTDDAASVGVNL